MTWAAGRVKSANNAIDGPWRTRGLCRITSTAAAPSSVYRRANTVDVKLWTRESTSSGCGNTISTRNASVRGAVTPSRSAASMSRTEHSPWDCQDDGGCTTCNAYWESKREEFSFYQTRTSLRRLEHNLDDQCACIECLDFVLLRQRLQEQVIT